jgi:hypothetical protein
MSSLESRWRTIYRRGVDHFCGYFAIFQIFIHYSYLSCIFRRSSRIIHSCRPNPLSPLWGSSRKCCPKTCATTIQRICETKGSHGKSMRSINFGFGIRLFIGKTFFPRRLPIKVICNVKGVSVLLVNLFITKKKFNLIHFRGQNVS